jgi:hypothetical protein
LDNIGWIVYGTVIGGLFSWFLGWVILRYIYPQLKLSGPFDSNVFKLETLNTITVVFVLAPEELRLKWIPSICSKKLWRCLIAFAIIIEITLAIIFGVFNVSKSISIFFGSLAAFTVAICVLLLIINRVLTKKVQNNAKFLNGLVGRHSVNISASEITDPMENRERTVKWSEVEDISIYADFLLIKVRYSTPLIIPKKAFADKRIYNNLIQVIKTHYRITIK